MHKIGKSVLVFFMVWALFACSAGFTDTQYVEKAQDYLDKGDLQAASIEAKNALQQNPKNAQARWLLGRLHLDIGDAAAAEKELLLAQEFGMEDDSTLPLLARALLLQRKNENVLSLSETNLSPGPQSEVLASQALALVRQGKVEEAASLIDKALSITPQSAYAREAKARILVAEQDDGQARNELNELLKHAPDYAPAWSLLGDLELREKRLEQAEEAFSKAIANHGNNMVDRLKRSLVRIQLKKYEQAQKDLDVLMKRSPQHVGVNYAQGLIFFLKSNLPEALTAFDRAVSGNRHYLPAVYYLSLTHLRLGNKAQAEQYANNLFASAPDSPPIRKLMAMISLENQQYEKVEELMSPVLLFNDKDTGALNLLANALLKQGRTGEAVELLERVVSLQPDSSMAQLRLGAGLLAGGEQKSGVERLEAILESSPEFQQANILLVMNYVQQQKFDQARIAAQTYQEQNPNSILAYNLLAAVYLAAKQEPEAREVFAKACAIAPGDPSACQNLAELAVKSKDFDKARDYYQGILQRNKNHLSTLLKLAALDALEKKEEAMVGHLKQAMKAHPKAAQPRWLLARYYLSKGEPDQVPVLLNELDDAQRKSPAVLSIMALSQLARKAFLDAKYTLEQLIELQPKSAQAHHQLAQAYAGLNDRKGTQNELEKAVKLAPEFLPARLALARLLLSEDRKEAAEEQLNVLREHLPDQPDILHLEASVASVGGDQEKALLKLEQAFKTSPSTTLMVSLARQKWDMGDRKGSLRLQEQWVNDHPNDITARLVLANVFVLEKRADDAIKQYRMILGKESRNLVALNNLAWYLRDSQSRQALEYAKRANDIRPESASIMDTLAVVLLKNGEVEKAQRMIERTLVKNPKDPSIRYHSAMINAEAGAQTSAIKILTILLGEDTNFSEKAEAEQLLEKLRSGG